MALGLLLFNTIMVSNSFYWTPNELIQGMAFVFLYAAIFQKTLKSNTNFWLLHLSLIACLITAIFAHPLLIVAILFSILFIALDHRSRWRLIIGQLSLTALIFIARFTVFLTWHDNISTQGVIKLKTLIGKFKYETFEDFFELLTTDYLLVSIAFGIVIIYYLRSKEVLKLLLVLAFMIGYIILVHIGQYSTYQQYYIESQHLILSLFVIFPLVIDVLPSLNKNLAILALVSILLFSLTRIYSTHETYTERLDWYRNFLEKTESLAAKKLIVSAEYMPMDLLLENWGSAFEIWLLSTIETGETRSVHFTLNMEQAKEAEAISEPKLFIVSWNEINYDNLKPQYFKMTDTLQTYTILDKEQLKEVLDTKSN